MKCKDDCPIAQVLLPAVQVLIKRVEAVENGTEVSTPVKIDGKTLKQLERDAIINALRENRGIQKRAAMQLGVSARVLNYKIEQLGLQKYCALTYRKEEK